MTHERLIKRSTVIERRLTGNIFSTVAIDKDENIIGCGCKKLYNLPQCGYVSLSSSLLSVYAVSNSGERKYKSLVPFDVELMPHCALESKMSAYNNKRIVDGEVVSTAVGTVYRDGTVCISGYCEAGEDGASQWSDIDDVLIVDGCVIGVTRSGRIELCGTESHRYYGMKEWTDVVLVKPIYAGIGCLAYDGIVGLRKDGSLLYCGKDNVFAEQISTYHDVVSFDGNTYAGSCGSKIRNFYTVMSDGSMRWYHGGDDLLPAFSHEGRTKDYLAVKYLPSGAHFIKLDGTIETHPEHYSYSDDFRGDLITMTGGNYEAVLEAVNNAKNNPLADRVGDWKLFDDPDEVLRRYEGFENKSFQTGNKCLYCGGELKGLLSKKCINCGKKAPLF